MRFLARFALLLTLSLGLWLTAAGQGPDRGAVRAQSDTSAGVDYADWENVARRAEDAVDGTRASTEALEQLRAELVEWRTAFEAARTTNAAAIATVNAQLATLGDPPESGDEPPDIAAEREELATRLAELQAPARNADLAWSRADALIRAIDRIIRERQTAELLELGPSPLNPVSWPSAIEAVMGYGGQIASELREAFQNPVRVAEARKLLPATLLLVIVGLVLLIRGRYWTEVLTVRVQDSRRTAQRYLLGFLISLGQVILPVGGMIALVGACLTTGLVGPRTEVLLTALPAAALSFFIARWVGGRMFPVTDVIDPPLDLNRQQRREGRFHSTALGLILFVYLVANEAGASVDWTPVTANVVLFPLLVLAGLMLARLSQLLVIHARHTEEGEEEPAFLRRMVLLMARAVLAIAIVGPVLAGIGYFKAGYAIIFPTVFSLQTLGILVILQRVVTELYVLVTRNREGARDALPPVLAGFMLALLSVPVFALIWGARVTDLTEIWARFRAGFDIGGTNISPGNFLTFLLVFAIGYVITRLIQGTLRNTVLPRTRLDIGGQTAMVSGFGYIGIFLAALVAITSAGINLSALGYVAGALSVGIGFGLQNIVSNFVSGIILLVERPISEGDWIEVGPNMGFVRSISVRSTRIETFDRTDVIVPNSDLVSGTVTNWTRGNLTGRAIIPVGVAYGSDTRRVEQILREIAEAQPVVVLNPPPFVFFKGFGASSLDFEVRCILRDVTQILVVQTEMNHQIHERFKAEGIEIPFPQSDVWLRNPETLRGGPSSDTPRPPSPPAVPDATERASAAAQITPADLGTDPDFDPDGGHR